MSWIVTFVGLVVGGLLARFLRAVMAPGGNLGGDLTGYPQTRFGPLQTVPVSTIGRGLGVDPSDGSVNLFGLPTAGVGISVNGSKQFGVSQNVCQILPILQAGAGVELGFVNVSTLTSGSGAPSNANGANGDYYFRQDTPGTVNQRLYVKSAGAWVGII
jgi:hypothetical protein